MARFIPVDGLVGAEEPFSDLMARYFSGGPRLVSFTRLDATREVIISQVDVTQVNGEATALANGAAIYGDAIVYRAGEGPG